MFDKLYSCLNVCPMFYGAWRFAEHVRRYRLIMILVHANKRRRCDLKALYKGVSQVSESSIDRLQRPVLAGDAGLIRPYWTGHKQCLQRLD